MTDINTDAVTETAGRVDLPTGHKRRGPGGRLYHGETSIDFYGRRWWGLIFSGVLILITIVSLFTRGLNLGMDFEGGVAWEVRSNDLTIEQARDLLNAQGIDGNNAKLQERTSQAGRSLLIQVGDQTQDVREKVQSALAEAAKVPLDEVSTNSVSATWGKSITEKAIRALVVFLVLVALYISWQLEWKMALTAILAMLHDVIISVGVYSVFGWEVTPATVVAFLTILGFSLYDTIVVFDKVKENTAKYMGSRVPYADVVNVSMNQVLMRSLNTNLSAVLPVMSLLILGSEIMGAVTLREFSLALLVGLITGSYSSVFTATPLLAIIKEREPRYAPYRNRHATGEDLERMVLGGSVVTKRELRAGRTAAMDEAGRSSQAAADPNHDATRVDTPTALLTHPPRPRKKKRRT
ncbi:MAG TPA: protein translocase subunit SecF [Ilumatobacteraceae bacterium]|nr:protein translocase subunit SecF [Ilumatobacteraceae bacterium]